METEEIKYDAMMYYVSTNTDRYGGRWYEIGEVSGTTREQAVLSRWPDGVIPSGYKLEEK